MADVPSGHAEHDGLLVAALLDRDVAPSERALGEALIAACPACSALHADLLALAAATSAQPVPSRPRDYRLSVADASRLGAIHRWEPDVAEPRLTREMTDSLGAAAHAAHDTLLVASLADHSLPQSERRAAEALVASCGACAALHADLVALASATRTMPTPTRPRDFTLSAETAARLRPSGWRRWVVAFGTSRDAFSRPLAVGLTTLGLAGLLVATVPSALQVGSATAPSAVEDAVEPSTGAAGRDTSAPEITGETTGAGAAPDAPSAAPAWAVSSAAPAPVASDRSGITYEPDGQTPAAGQGDTATGSTKGSGSGSGESNDLGMNGAERASAPDDIGRSPMAVVSIALLFLGLGLFAVRRVARRVDVR